MNKPDCMQSILQSLLPRLTTDEILDDLHLVLTATLKSAGIVENITLMCRENEFVLDAMHAALQLKLWSAVSNKTKVVEPRERTRPRVLHEMSLLMIGPSVVSHTLCKILVLPEFALPVMRTRNWISGIWGWSCCASIMPCEKEDGSRCIIHEAVTELVLVVNTVQTSADCGSIRHCHRTTWCGRGLRPIY